MARANPQLRATLAQDRLAAARSKFRRDAAPWRAEFARHRAAWLLAGGFTGGLAVGMLPRGFWSKFGALLGSTSAIMARAVFAPVLAGALAARDRDATATPAAIE
jgi:predicted lipid-binding transport protein (Tim44 family)